MQAANMVPSIAQPSAADAASALPPGKRHSPRALRRSVRAWLRAQLELTALPVACAPDAPGPNNDRRPAFPSQGVYPDVGRPVLGAGSPIGIGPSPVLFAEMMAPGEQGIGAGIRPSQPAGSPAGR